MLHNLRRTNPSYALRYTSIDIGCVWRCRYRWRRCCRYLSRPSRNSNRALSERLGLFCSSIMRSFRISFEGFSKCLGFGRSIPGAGRIIRLWQGTGRSAHGSKIVWKNFDKVGWEQADRPPVSSQSTRPPRSVSSVETLNQVALNKAQVPFGLYISTGLARPSPDCSRREVSAFSCDTKQGPQTSPPNEYTALHQQGNRVGMVGGPGTIFLRGSGDLAKSRWESRG